MKQNDKNQTDSPFQYQSMGSLLAANYYKEKYEETKDSAFLEKYEQYSHQLELYKQLEAEQKLMRFKKKLGRCIVLPMMLFSLSLTSIFLGFFQEEDTAELDQETEIIDPARVLQMATPELTENLPKGYQSFPLKNESQVSTPIEQILRNQRAYAKDTLEQEIYSDLSQVFRSALYQYVKKNDGKFPTNIAVLFDSLPRNYLTGIPRDPLYYSNQITETYDGTGGWVYDSKLGERALQENRSLFAAVCEALECNGDCGKPDFSPIQITIVKSKHQMVVHTANQVLASYPVALGKSSTQTPEGRFYVKRKLAYPRKDLAQKTNPYGSRLIELSNDAYAIHGTPQEELLGQNVSKGCIRMKNADIIELFSYVSLGTQIQIVKNQSENPKLVEANQKQKEFKTLTPSPMLMSPKLIDETKPKNNQASNKGDGKDTPNEGDGKENPSQAPNQEKQPNPSDSLSDAGNSPPKNVPSSLLPKNPRPDEQSSEIRKWKN